MKKILLVIIGLLFLFNVEMRAVNRFWVGGTGNWNEQAHWSAASGGAGGASIPTLNDNVYFDGHSFSAPRQCVKLNVDGICHHFDWSGIDKQAVFAGMATKKLRVSGSFTLSALTIYGFKGQTEFTAATPGNVILTNSSVIYSDLVFSGSGSWLLNDELHTSSTATISLLKGSLNTNNNRIVCGSFTSNSTDTRSLHLGTSEIDVRKIWDLSSPVNLLFDGENSNILFDATVDNTNFRSGGLRYGNVGVSAQSQNTTTCVFPQFTITLTADSVTCNSLCDGAAHVVVTGGSGAPVFDWNFGATPTGDGTANITGLCASTNTVKVTEIIGGVSVIHFCSISVGEPPPLNDFEASSTRPLCFGDCNGFIDVDETGGTPPYTYSWSGGLGNNDTAVNVCSGVYTATVTDSRGCTDNSAVINLTQPALLVAPGAVNMVSCFGACNGSASTNPSGGTPPYTYNWTGSVGGPLFAYTGQGTNTISNLCPGTYTVTVKDSNNCTTTFDTTITQPPVLTLSMSHTNATCGGVCNGTATATITGGTSPYIYSWSNGTTVPTASLNNTISALCAAGGGKFIVTVTDANGCSKTDSVVITEPALLVATATGVNPSCFGLCNGTATVAVVGGTPGYSYNWNGTPTGDLTPTASGLCVGSYTVTVNDVNGCNDTAAVVLTQPALVVANPVSTNVSCNGGSNGTATASPAGGTLPYVLNWTPGNPTGDGTTTITNLIAGSYCITVTDAHGCDTTQCVNVTEPTALTASITKVNVLCNGACNGTATANPAGGTAPYSYSWTGPAGFVSSSQTISSLCPGIYTVTVTDANGCTKVQNVTITQPNILNLTLSGTVILCNADCNATITSVVSGGTPGYTFLWSPGGQTTSSITGQCAGVYSLTVTDANGCTKTVGITLSQPTALTVVTSFTNISCFGVCNGTASVIAGGGTPGYTYSWAPGGQTTSFISGLCAGVYTVTVKDANNCITTGTVTITSPPQLLGNPAVSSPISCSGICDGAATSSATGGTPGYTYNWDGAASPAGDGTATITSLCTGIHTLIVTDANGCTSNQSVNVTQPTPLTAPITGSTSSCNVCNGTATVTPAGGTPPYTILWPGGQSTPTAVGLCPNQTYIVSVTDAHGCTASGVVTITQTITITITTSNTTLSCAGACDGIATANAAGGAVPYTFLWTTVPGGITVDTIATASPLCAGSYAILVQDVNGCLNRDTVTFTNPPALSVTETHANASCGGTCNGTATGTPAGGTPPYTYSWNTVPMQSTQTATGLCAGSYVLNVTDASGCTAIVPVTITEPPIIVDNPTFADANCLLSDGSISVAPAGGTGAYTFTWAPGVTLAQGQGTATIINLLPGAYTLNITDGAGCSYNFNYLINNINGPTLSMAHTDVVCHNNCDGTATVTASGGAPGYTYSWSGAPAGNGTPAVTALCGTQTWTVTVTDAAGCITLDTARVINPALISPNQVVTNESCGGTGDGAITLNPTGGTGPYTYAWIPVLPATPNQIGLGAGPYQATITDANGCDTTITINITAPPMLTVTTAFTNVLCNSACNGTATATITGGAPGYTISWPALGPAIILPNVVNLCPGQYIINVTDANSCTASDTVDITEPVALTTVTSQTNASCNGLCDGTATVTAAGGTLPYGYSWNDAATTLNDTVLNLCAASYIATVTDANGCVSTPPPVMITQPAPIVPNVTFTNPSCNSSCNGTATSAVAGGTAPYAYNWSPGITVAQGQGTAAVTSLCGIAYTLMITDSLGCSNSQTVILIAPATLIANPISTSPTCTNSCNGSVTASPVGGTAGYTYAWSPGGAVTQTVNSLCPNIYQVIVTDANNCKDTQNVTVVNPLPINVAVSSTPAACNVCDGTMTINPLTGTPGYTYFWSPAPTAGQGTPNATSVCAGLYDVTVTDVNGCDSTFTLALNNAGGVTGETVTTTNATCNAVCNGTGSVIPVGGTAPFTYVWNDPPMTPDSAAINLCAGNYFVTISDSNTCLHFSPVNITQPAPILSNATITSAICSNVCNGVISLAASGGTPGYTYVWTSPFAGPIAGQGTPTITGLCPGTYSVSITDINGCPKLDSFVVSQSTPLTVVAAGSNVSCSNANTGMAYITISSGTAPFTIQWDDAAGQTNDTATALAPGTYTATITDANGCFTTASATVTASPAVAVNATITNATCGVCDGTALAAPTGGTAPYTYVWSNGQTTANASGLCSGLYTVNITDNSGCISSFSIPVSNTTGPASVAISSTNILCNGANTGAVTAVTPSGGTAPYSYLWIGSGATTPTLSGLGAGAYFIQVTDASGCSIVDSVTITEPAPILANQVVTAATCGLSNGAITVNASGGTAGYGYLWNTGPVTPTITSLSAGVYSVLITDAAGCTVNAVIPVNSQNGPSIIMSSTNVSCNAMCNGTSTVTVLSGAAPFAYLWNDVGVQTTPTATALCPGSYAVVVTGSNGCVTVGMTTITEPDSIGFSIASTVNPLCNGDTTGVITAIPSGGTLGYTYAWTPSGGTAATASSLTANTYTVTVTDAMGCTATQSTTLTQTNALTISSVITNPSCNTLSDGAIDVTVGGGTLTYTYSWTGVVAATEDVSGLSAGSYTINVTDGNGCMIADTSVLIPTQSVFVSAGNDTSFCQNGSITLSAVSSTGITYQWFQLPGGTSVGGTASVILTPPAGTTDYYVMTDNGSGCSANDTIIVTSNVLPTADAGPDVTIITGASTPIGGSPTGSSGTTLIWSPLPGLDNATIANPTATPSTTTTYTVFVTTAQGCSATDSMIVTVLPSIVIPDGISPNADGDNDEWIIDGIELFPNCNVEVYNRWGELLFQSVGYKEHWKGTYKGKDLPVGSYYYVIDLKDPLFPDVYTGPITILR